MEESAKATEPKVLMGPLHKNNVGAFRKIIETVFPVRYTDTFYEGMTRSHEDFTHMCYFQDLVVGVIGCKEEVRPDGKRRLYIAALAVLAPYRNLGIGAKLLGSALDCLPSHPDIVEVYLHVHSPNTRAVAFYRRLGFEEVGLLSGYYPELTPSDGILLRRMVQEGFEPSVSLEFGGAGAPMPVIDAEAVA